MEHCLYCLENPKSAKKDDYISGKYLARTWDWQNTAGYNPDKSRHCFYPTVNPDSFEELEAFILKGKNDKKAGLFINTINGARFIDINYCPMCGRKLG